MKKYRGKLLLFFMMALFLFVTGCTQQTKISDKQLTDDYSQSINGLAKVIDGYSRSMKTGDNYVNEPAQKQINWINKTQEDLKKDNSGNKKAEYLSNFLDSLETEIKEYKNNNFNDQQSISNNVAQSRKKLEKTLNVDDSTKVSSAKSNVSKSWNNLKKVLAAQPHVDNKTVINKNGEIRFDSVNEIPGFQGDKTVEVKYTYKNTTDEPQGAFEALLANGDFTQENDDSVNSLEMGIADSDWEESHPQAQQMSNDGTMSKLKPDESKQYVTYLKVNNFDTPIVFKATNSDTNQGIGNIKLNINE